MKTLKRFTFLIAVLVIAVNSLAQKAPSGWGIVGSWTIPGKASGLAWDGTYIYFGIYGSNGNEIYKFNPTTGTATLQCTGSFGDAYGLTYKSPNLVTIDQPSSSSIPANALEFSMSGTTVSSLALPNHYMSGIAYDAGSYWVCTYYPDPGTIYHISSSGTVLSQFTPPANQPWDICTQGSDLWIADYNANNLYKVTSTGTLIEMHAAAWGKPSGVVFDGTYLWYCDGQLSSPSTLYKVDLSASGTPQITVPVTSHDYGAVPIGTPSSWNCQVQNTGTANLSITGVVIPSGQPVSTTFTTPQTIAPGGSLNIPLIYTPVAAIPLNTQVTINSSDPIHPSVQVTLTGNGVYAGAHISLPTGPHDYGERRAGAYSRWFLDVTNDGSQQLTITGLSTSDPHFIVDESAAVPINVPPLETTHIGIWFHPEDGIQYNGNITITSNAAGQSPISYSLQGTGVETVYPRGTVLWSYVITAGFDNSPKSIMPGDDITGDSVADIVVGSEDNFIRCFNGNASVEGDVLWATEITSGSVYNQNSMVKAGDINNDGYDDMIIGTAWGDRSIIAVSGKTGNIIWKHDTHEYGDGGWVYQVFADYDYNNDGFNDVLTCTGNDGNNTGPVRVYCLNGKTGISIWQYYAGGPVFSVIGVEDFTGDGKPDVIAGASNLNETAGRIYGLDGSNGSLKWTCIPSGTSVWGLIQIDDINSDGIKDVAAGDYSGKVYFLDAVTGNKVYNTSLGNVLILRLEDMGDLNKDGYKDFMVAHSGTNAVVIDGKTCTFLWNKPLADKSWNVSNIGDITFDGYNDAIVGTLYQSNYVYFIDGVDGTFLDQFPTGDPVDAIKAIPDIVGDYTMEMLAGTRSGGLACLSGGYDTSTVSVGPAIVPDAMKQVIVYPNPSKGIFNISLISNTDQMAIISVINPDGVSAGVKEQRKCERGVNNITISLPPGSPGFYILEIKLQDRIYREKILRIE